MSTQYQSYLLRLWSTGDNSKLRATLLSVHNPDEQRHFATLDDLVIFLSDLAYPILETVNEAGETEEAMAVKS